MSKFKRLLLTVIANFLWLVPVSASPIDDASKYSVRIKSTIRYAFAAEEAGTSSGAGFLVNKERGWVLTNAHVSGYGTGDVEVSFKGYGFFTAKPIYVDTELDLAVIQIDTENIPKNSSEAKLDCADRPLNGLTVAAFGHPYGLTFSASRGIISKVRYYRGIDWIQTDAAINPGNSGGPLIDLDTGLIVGINAMSLENTEGLNFAVPTKPVCKILELMADQKNPSPPKLPIKFAVNKDTEEYLIVGGGDGNKLPTGFALGDRLTRVANQEISTPTDLKTYLRGKTGEISVTLMRGTEEIEATLSFNPEPRILDRPYILADGALITQDVYPERWEMEGFFQVQSVRDGSYADRVGLVPYRLIMSINSVRPKSLEHVKKLLDGDEKKVVIFRSWSAQDLKMYDYHEVIYWPYEVKLMKAGGDL